MDRGPGGLSVQFSSATQSCAQLFATAWTAWRAIVKSIAKSWTRLSIHTLINSYAAQAFSYWLSTAVQKYYMENSRYNS